MVMEADIRTSVEKKDVYGKAWFCLIIFGYVPDSAISVSLMNVDISEDIIF